MVIISGFGTLAQGVIAQDEYSLEWFLGRNNQRQIYVQTLADVAQIGNPAAPFVPGRFQTASQLPNALPIAYCHARAAPQTISFDRHPFEAATHPSPSRMWRMCG
ncbi:MAG: hypothetical protein LBO00_07200 [Zoogloeaceae bacterium]|nr:hypothetical protein [Zoogloeaceae bacterium]